ncbi:hypothetical protein [Streptomyces sp. TP-A0356]|uniref:hypothetical protein n=1 Tax=Streptomyces sp. TP-A0356 TaxID=1359208 RepID=UPI000B1396A2|nr:hypothetical protein [Streptomyces sp. TP-A0356]
MRRAYAILLALCRALCGALAIAGPHTSVHGATAYAGLVRDAPVAEDLIPEGPSR